jgi:hypothetical protein
MNLMSGARRPSSFDLLENAFVVLGITPATSNENALQAYEDRLAEPGSSESRLNDAKQSILNPRLRLSAELSYLLDTPDGVARDTYDRIKRKESTSNLEQLADRLAPLSKVNLIVHVIGSTEIRAELILAYISAREALQSDVTHQVITRIRKTAGIVIPDIDTVSEAIRTLDNTHSKTMVQRFRTPQDAAIHFRQIVNRVIQQGNSEQIYILEILLRTYSSYVSPMLLEIYSQIATHLRAIDSAEASDSDFDSLFSNLRKWNQIDEPLQLMETFKGRDEPNARALFNEVRQLAIKLANEKQKYEQLWKTVDRQYGWIGMGRYLSIAGA